MLELVAHLNSLGFPVREIIPDKKHHRFEIEKGDRQAGYYTCFRNCMVGTGQDWYFIIFGSWRTGERHEYSTLDKETAHHIDSKLLKEQIALAKKQEDKVRQEGYEVASKECEEKWGRLSVTGTSEYLTRKQVADCPGLDVRYDNFNGDTYIKLVDENAKIWSLQTLRPNGVKILHKGGKKSGNFCPIGDYLKADKIYIAEGIATAASIRMAINEPVICAIDSGNLENVAIKFRKLFPEKEIIICGDDDRDAVLPDGTANNAGKISAKNAATKSRSSFVFPLFKNPKFKEDTDWNDLHVAEGLEAVAEQILTIEKADPYDVYALGHKSGEYFFTSKQNRQVVSISSFTEKDLLDLMTIDYWERQHPGHTSKVDWTAAKSKLMAEARQKGIFEPQNVRGAGVWNDEGRVIVNMGDHLIVDGKLCELGSVKSDNFYTLGVKLPKLHPYPLTIEECKTIIDVAHLFKWKRSDFGYLIAGAMVTSRVCGALPIRPHLWITGEAGQGKSTLFDYFILPLLGENRIYVAGNTTEAGIRQRVNCNALPVLFDEFENNGTKSAELIQANLDLMRVAWSNSNACILKGSATGNSVEYHPRFSAIVTSIRQVHMGVADQSRFATIELDRHGNDQEHWALLSSLLDKIDTEMGDRLFARCIKLIPIIIKNFGIIKKLLVKKSGAGQRFADQYGMLLAAYSILIMDSEISINDAEMLISEIKLEEEKEISKISDQEKCLDRILTTKITVDGITWRRDATIGELISGPTTTEDTNCLLRLGIKIDSDKKHVLFCNSNTELEKVFNNTQWHKSWALTLSRLPNAVKNQAAWIHGKTQKCVKIPMSQIVEDPPKST